MTKKAVSLLLACTLILGLAACGFGGSSALSITINNKLDYDMYELHISPVNVDSWGEDLLPAVLYSGDETSVELAPELKAGAFDVWTTDTDGDYYYFYNVPIAGGTELRFDYQDYNPILISTPKRGNSVTIMGEFEYNSIDDYYDDDDDDDDNYEDNTGSDPGDTVTEYNNDGTETYKDFSLGIGVIYPEDYVVIEGFFDDAILVADDNENCVVVRNATEDWYDFIGSDDDFLDNYLTDHLYQDFIDIYGDGSFTDNGSIYHESSNASGRLSTADINMYNDTQDMQLRAILTELNFDDGTAVYIVAGYFSQYDSPSDAASIRKVTFKGVRR